MNVLNKTAHNHVKYKYKLNMQMLVSYCFSLHKHMQDV